MPSVLGVQKINVHPERSHVSIVKLRAFGGNLIA
jgi:hypothetical protein